MGKEIRDIKEIIKTKEEEVDLEIEIREVMVDMKIEIEGDNGITIVIIEIEITILEEIIKSNIKIDKNKNNVKDLDKNINKEIKEISMILAL